MRYVLRDTYSFMFILRNTSKWLLSCFEKIAIRVLSIFPVQQFLCIKNIERIQIAIFTNMTV